jgi:hypothetical protein
MKLDAYGREKKGLHCFMLLMMNKNKLEDKNFKGLIFALIYKCNLIHL